MRGRDSVIVPVELSEDFASGEVGEDFAPSSFVRPTTIARYDIQLLIVNSQFYRRESSGESPELPFAVSSIEVPWLGTRYAIRPPPPGVYRVDGIPGEYNRRRRMK